jgi:hypothetical protein
MLSSKHILMPVLLCKIWNDKTVTNSCLLCAAFKRCSSLMAWTSTRTMEGRRGGAVGAQGLMVEVLVVAVVEAPQVVDRE